jgi:transposase
MRQVHRAGEKAFVDYSGVNPQIVDRKTGEVIEVELYVAVLGASSFTFAEATRTQQRDEFIASTARAFEYFDGVPEITVPDQLRSAVSGPDRLDPDINPVFAEFAEHYGTAVIPARPRKPKDKAKVEVGVQIAQRWILARLRNVTFFSLEDLNAAIAKLLEELNDRPFQKLEGCRRSVYEQVERSALQPLPTRRFEPSVWKKAKINIDYHVDFEARYYSASHHLIGSDVWVRATVSTIELLLDGRRIASHTRSYGPKGTYVTENAHRPKSHRQWGAWPPQRVIDWASELGPDTGRVVELIIANKPHPEQGYRSCLALIRDVKRYDDGRVEAACKRALRIGAPTRRSVVAILKNGLDRVVDDDDEQQLPPAVVHENVRGGDYYATGPDVPDHPEQKHEQGDNDNAGRTDVPENVRDEDERDGRGLPRAAAGSPEQPTQLRREGRPHDRPRVDGAREPTPVTAAPSGEADPRCGDGGRVDDPGPRRDQDGGA